MEKYHFQSLILTIEADLQPCVKKMKPKTRYDIDKSAECAGTVLFGLNPTVGNDALILGGKYGSNFHVGEFSMLAEGTSAGNDVHIGDFVCVEKDVKLSPSSHVPDHSVVKLMKGVVRVFVKGPEQLFKLEDGVCVQ